jgi:hypothetical protein
MFIVFDLGESIPSEYQKIPYHLVFDVLRRKARLAADDNWTINDKEVI